MTISPSNRDTEDQGLAQRSARGGALMLAGRGVEAVVTVGSMMVLARLLEVADFGVFAMAAVVISFFMTLNTLGLWGALVQAPSLSDHQCQRVFRLSLVFNLGLVGLLVGLSPLVGWFFDEPRAAPLLWALSLGMFFNGLGSVPDGLAKRKMRYGILSLGDITASIVSASAAIGVGWAGWGAWALVTQQVLMYGMRGAGRWLAAGWMPHFHRLGRDRDQDSQPPHGIKAIMQYSGGFTSAKLIRRLGRRADQLIVGAIAGAGPLGLYSAAYRWALFTIERIHPPLMAVCVSSFSRLQNVPSQLRTYVHRGFTAVYSLILPVLGLLFVEAEPIILILLGQKWLAAVPIFRCLLVAMVGEAPLILNRYIYYSDGRTGRQARWTVVEAGVMIGGAVVGAVVGLVNKAGGQNLALAVAVGHAGAVWMLVVPSAWYCAWRSVVDLPTLLGPMIRPALAAVGAAGGTLAMTGVLPPMHFIIQLMMASGIFAGLYIAIWIALPGGVQQAASLQSLIRSIRHAGEPE